MTLDLDLRPAPNAAPPDEGATVVPFPRSAGKGDRAGLERDVRTACERIAPLFPLRSFVAVNAFEGFATLPFARAAVEIDRLFHADATMHEAFYAERLRSGRIDAGELPVALDAAPAEDGAAPPADARVRTLAEHVDREDGSDWSGAIETEIAKWCAARYDEGQSSWKSPFRDAPTFAAWREMALLDRNPELLGLRGFRAYVRALPEEPLDAIAVVLARLGIDAAQRADVLTRALASIGGWAAHARRLDRAGVSSDAGAPEIVHVLAIRMAFDGALGASLEGRCAAWRVQLAAAAEGADAADASFDRRLAWQRAYERTYQRELAARLSSVAPRRRPGDAPRPALQAVFCIDVRSEPLRRHLEAHSDSIETIGFAGFFGFALEVVQAGAARGDARCPVLIDPTVRVRQAGAGGDDERIAARSAAARRRHERFGTLRKLAVGTYPLVETLGHFFGVRLVTDALGWTRVHEGGALLSDRAGRDAAPVVESEAATNPGEGLDAATRVDLAEAALRNMGLTDRFAEVVLLCGHGSDSSNNPYAAGLDCGACGGHPGDVNARVAAAVLNAPEVRSELGKRGILVPDDTVFVAGLHDTTRDVVRLFDADRIEPGRRARIEAWLEAACGETRAERSGGLGERPGPGLAKRLDRRANDWSQIRPEWGLARNAAFIAAPRDRTRGLDLGGRVFLHEYDAAKDEDGGVLELILTAPLVVASWINLQYYASTVDPQVFGSGRKALHNVVGRHGVQLGNRSDLKAGLPWESVHDGCDFVHEPLRLTAIVEAPVERIDAVLERHEGVRTLVENEWIHLMARDPESGRLRQRTAAAPHWRALPDRDGDRGVERPSTAER